MANSGDLTATGASIEQESPVVPPPPPREIPTANIPPPRFAAPNRVNLTEENQSLLNSFRSSASLTRQERNTCMQSLYNLMTSSEEDAGSAQFREVVSRFDEDGSDLRKMASLLTSDLDHFLEMARDDNGSNRIQELLGIRDDVDTFFYNAILSRFDHIMTDYEASDARDASFQRGEEDRNVQLRSPPRGSPGLLYVVAQNALDLSYHARGNYVVQHVLQLNDLRSTRNVAVSLSGHYFGLSFTKFGSYVVEKLLDTEEAAVMVVEEFLRCEGESLVRLATSSCGNFVVVKALRVMRERNRTRRDLFGGLVNKLRPYVHLLRGRNVGAFLYWLR
ncbi:hypothetical protein DY000_02001072 [Brassica cretica]|uniref:PUM-HD domain-containing protein n=1 Tax=Brassica cretica TaxID=69181 RepID=A0ABQ7CJU5_BRACR|nr:hypothetical protein DY000_02001072 [Brassica cretica]